MKKLISVVLLCFSQFAFADCLQFSPLEKDIQVPNSVELCNSFYAVKYDTVKSQPIISVEKFRSGTHPERSNDFHPDPRLMGNNQAHPNDYTNTGYDRGHLTPAADATTDVEMHDTFLMSNMTPQQKTVNEISWRLLENHVRDLAPDYVVTGAVYNDSPEVIGTVHRVPVPVGYFKLTYKSGNISAWYAANTAHAPVVQTTLTDIEAKTNLSFPKY